MSCFVTIIYIYVHETDAKRVLNNRKRFNHCNQHGFVANKCQVSSENRKRRRKRRGGEGGLRYGIRHPLSPNTGPNA